MKISFFAFAVNDKFPIDIVYRQFKKYVKEEFEYILFNDAMTAEMEQNINTIANYNNIKCVRVPQNIHTMQDPSQAYAATLNWAVHEYAPQNDYEVVVLMHTDVFPICDVVVSDIIGENIAASTTEFRIMNGKGITYFYPALTMINMKKLTNPHELDFRPDTGLDCGGRTKDFIKNHETSIKFLNNHQIAYMIAILEGEPIADYFSTDLTVCRAHGLSAGWVADGFYHHMAGSQWNASNLTFAAGHKKRMELFLKQFY